MFPKIPLQPDTYGSTSPESPNPGRQAAHPDRIMWGFYAAVPPLSVFASVVPFWQTSKRKLPNESPFSKMPKHCAFTPLPSTFCRLIRTGQWDYSNEEMVQDGRKSLSRFASKLATLSLSVASKLCILSCVMLNEMSFFIVC